MKLALVLYAAELLAERPKPCGARAAGPLGRCSSSAGCACCSSRSQPDLGTALVIAFTLGAMLIAARRPLRHLAIVAGVGAVPGRRSSRCSSPTAARG